jgi:hypothetical protein
MVESLAEGRLDLTGLEIGAQFTAEGVVALTFIVIRGAMICDTSLQFPRRYLSETTVAISNEHIRAPSINDLDHSPRRKATGERTSAPYEPLRHSMAPGLSLTGVRLNEAIRITRLTRFDTEIVLQISQRANPSSNLHENAPCGRWKMNDGHPAPPHRECGTQKDEQDERQVEHKDGGGGELIKHDRADEFNAL